MWGLLHSPYKLCFSIETKKVGGSNKRQLLLDTTIDPTENGTIIDMATFVNGGEEVICFATTMGKLYGLDIRSNKPAWDLKNSAKFGKERGGGEGRGGGEEGREGKR